MKAKYQIYDQGKLVPAFTRKVKDPRAVAIGATTAEERRIGLKYYIPADKL